MTNDSLGRLYIQREAVLSLYGSGRRTRRSPFRGDAKASSPESILTIVVMDSGLALRSAPRNDEGYVPGGDAGIRRSSRTSTHQCPAAPKILALADFEDDVWR